MPTNLIAYHRVSTARQGASGLGLEGQAAAVATYARPTNGDRPTGLHRDRDR